jgi:DNA repair protein RecO (recombination protein O)
MQRTTEGIVIRTLPYGEADLLVTFFTLDFGLLKAFAKSPRKTKSRFGSSLEPLTCSRVSVMGKEGASLPRLTQSDIIRPFQGLREDVNCFLMLTEMSELIMSFMPEGEVNKNIYNLLRQVMEMMEGSCGKQLSLLFKIRFLSLKGYQPRLKGCAKCGKESQKFYQSQGSVICGRCASSRVSDPREDVIDISTGLIKLCDALGSWNIDMTPRIRASNKMIEEVSHVFESHIEHILSKRLRTREFREAM